MAKRRQNGEGTIYQRPNGLWVCEVTLGYDKDKKRIKKTVSSMDLEKLHKKINEIKYLNDRNMVAEPSKYTVSEWLTFWLNTYKKNQIKESTYTSYMNSIEMYLIPLFGDYKLDSLTTNIIQKSVNKMEICGLNEKELSSSYIKRVFGILSQAYKKAIDLEMIYKNPCSKIDLPVKRPRDVVEFSKIEQDLFLSFCKGENTYENLFIFAFNTGARLGELQALTWDDLDEKNKLISINKTLSVVNDYSDSENKQKTIIDTAKTKNSTRDIPLTKQALNALKRQRKSNKKSSPFIFYSTSGTPVQKRNVYRAFDNIIEKSGIKSPVTFHSFRHSFATRLLEKKADIKTVSMLLGHSSIQITLNLYSHSSLDLKKKTIKLLNN